MQRPLFLTGMMGCGKTTVGRVLADARGWPLVDLDARIERLFGVSIPELFAAGEERFRELERRALESLLAEPGITGRAVVVATGGGAVLDSSSRARMDAAGTRVFLDVGVDELVRRLRPAVEAEHEARPLLEGDQASLRQRVAELLASRRSAYRGGALCVDGQGDPAVVAERVVVALGEDPAREDCEAV